MGKVVIGVCGRKRAGKDEVAKALEVLGFRRAAFADPLKRMVYRTFNVKYNQLYGDDKEVRFRLSDRMSRVDLVRDATEAVLHAYGLRDISSQGLRAAEERWSMPPERVVSVYVAECLAMYDRGGMTSGRQLLQQIGTDICREKIHDLTWVRATMEPIEQSDHERWIISDTRAASEFQAIRSANGISGIIRVDRPSLGSQSDFHVSEVEWQSLRVDAVLENDFTVEALHDMARRAVLDIIER